MAGSLPRINREIFKAIQAHPSMKGLSERTIYYKIEDMRKQIGTWHSRGVAAAYLASTLGIDVYRLLSGHPEELAELKELGIPASVTQTKVVRKFRESLPISVDEKVVETFLLPSNLAKQAKEMASLYPFFYVFENLLRYVIVFTLKTKHGKDWWNIATISKEIKDQVDTRKKAEGRNRWVGRRGSHDVFYTDLGDLGLIINSSYNDFKAIFPSLTWIKSRVDDLEKSRNILAHNNPLPSNEMKRIKIYLQDLQNQLAGKLG